jgi:phage terminase large subunit-like protein
LKLGLHFGVVPRQRHQGGNCAVNLISALLLVWANIALPKDNIVSKSKKDGANYLAWEKAGYLTLLDGDVIDYDYIYEDILAIDKEIEADKS